MAHAGHTYPGLLSRSNHSEGRLQTLVSAQGSYCLHGRWLSPNALTNCWVPRMCWWKPLWNDFISVLLRVNTQPRTCPPGLQSLGAGALPDLIFQPLIQNRVKWLRTVTFKFLKQQNFFFPSNEIYLKRMYLFCNS